MTTIILKCRICLEDFEEKSMRSLFDEEEDLKKEADDVEINDTHTMNISEQIEFCCGVKLFKSEEVSSLICSQCSGFLLKWFRFRQMCLDSKTYWESSGSDVANSTELEYLSDQFEVGFDNDMDLKEYNYLVEPIDVPTSIKTKNKTNPSQLLTLNADQEAVTSQDNIYFKESESDDILSPTPSPEPKPLTTKHKPGRPRRPDYDLKSKRRQSSDKKHYHHHHQIDKEKESPVIYECNFCCNDFQTKTAFTAHKATHTKPHQCELCDKSFRQMGELRAHIRRHTGERPYKCLYCKRCFSDRSEKLKHERVHTNTRPYECKVCGKSFTNSTILKNHSLVHSGTKNYNCAICSKSFSLLHQLKAHLQTLTHKSKKGQQDQTQSV